jgi:phosphonate transport system substrate-binding protein
MEGKMTGMKRLLLLLMISFSLILSCERKEVKPKKEPPPSSEREVVIGLIPERNVFAQVERYQPLADYLSDRLKMRIKLTILSRHGNIIDNFHAEKMDGAFFGSFTGAMTIKKLGVEPLARPIKLDGTSTYHGYIFVRKDSGIKGFKDMEAKSFAFVDKATTAGYIFPIAYFRENGIKDLKRYLGDTYFTGSHDEAVMAVLNREADIGAAKNTIYEEVLMENPKAMEELLILAESPKVPENGLSVRKDLGPALKKGIKETLLNMDKDEEGRKVLSKFRAQRFIETTEKDYEPVFKIVEKAGIDLKTYVYINQ